MAEKEGVDSGRRFASPPFHRRYRSSAEGGRPSIGRPAARLLPKLSLKLVFLSEAEKEGVDKGRRFASPLFRRRYRSSAEGGRVSTATIVYYEDLMEDAQFFADCLNSF